MKTIAAWGVIFVLGVLSSGCAMLNKGRRADELEKEVIKLRNQLEQFQEAKDTELERAKRELARTLEKELSETKAKLEMTERGLVITFLAEVFFDSGKDAIRDDGKAALQKVAKVLNEDAPSSPVAIEGHTDTDPIKHSGWKSNWELSSARALAVLHYFIDEGRLEPVRLSANGYGEFSPVASNEKAEGKQKNRRVEIVILPSKLSKVKS